MLEHPGIVFEVDAVEGKRFSHPIDFSDDRAADDDRLVILGDLKIAWAIGIKVGFAVELAEFGDLRIDGAAKLDSFAARLPC